jgi:hypothetical protein
MDATVESHPSKHEGSGTRLTIWACGAATGFIVWLLIPKRVELKLRKRG